MRPVHDVVCLFTPDFYWYSLQLTTLGCQAELTYTAGYIAKWLPVLTVPDTENDAD